jgi:hypothetical protein
MTKLKIDDLTFGELRQIANLFTNQIDFQNSSHPMIGKHCVIRTYSAGIHIGTVKAVDGTEVLLENSFRLWYWEGAFTLTKVAKSGVSSKSRRSEEINEIYLTQAIEFIPTTSEARKSYENLEIKNA